MLWTGEFGRLPISQRGHGRDHNRNAFSLVLAGGGFKAGHVHGRTDDLGYAAVEGRVSCPDLLATILHQLGLDHDRLKYSAPRARGIADRFAGDACPGGEGVDRGARR